MSAPFPPPPHGSPVDRNGNWVPAWDAWFRQVLYRQIAAIIPGNIPGSSGTTPLMDGTAAAGTEPLWAHGDHRHPTDTSRAAVTDLAPLAPKESPDFTGTIKVVGTQILTSQQTGMGATLSPATAGATYGATERAMLQAAYDKILALETRLKTHGLIAI